MIKTLMSSEVLCPECQTPLATGNRIRMNKTEWWRMAGPCLKCSKAKGMHMGVEIRLEGDKDELVARLVPVPPRDPTANPALSDAQFAGPTSAPPSIPGMPSGPRSLK